LCNTSGPVGQELRRVTVAAAGHRLERRVTLLELDRLEDGGSNVPCPDVPNFERTGAEAFRVLGALCA
jgi:hypothetical protein